MTKTTSETPQEFDSVILSGDEETTKKCYESPLLIEWGSIVELTGGGLSGTVDGDFSGSGGV